QYLKNRIKQHGGRWRAVFSALADKDIAQVVANLEEVIAEWHVAPLQVERAATREQLEKAFAGSNLSKIRWSESITDAFLDAVAASQLEDYVLVFGSFFTVGAILEFMQTHSPDEALLSSHPV